MTEITRTRRMSNSFPTSRSTWGTTRPSLCLLAVLLLASAGVGRAHDTLGECVQHAVHLTVGAQHMDVTLDLTFFEQWSASERAAMDADGDGTITRSEQETYLKRLGAGLCKQVKLFVAGRELPLAPLYDPELDLLGNSRVGPSHHRLRLFFFAATPAHLRAGDEMVIEDRLWPEAKTLATPRFEGRDGCRLAPGVSANAVPGPGKAGQRLRATFKCLQPPSAKPPPPPAAGIERHHRWRRINPDQGYSKPHFCHAGTRLPGGDPRRSQAPPASDFENLCSSMVICGLFGGDLTPPTNRPLL